MLPKPDERRLVVIGRTGSGISSIANSILREKHFKSNVSMKSVTTVAETAEFIQGGKKIIVVNTPGMFNTEISNDEVKAQLKNAIEMMAPGPHLFLYVFPLGRQTDEEEETIKEMIDVFGNEFLKHTIIVFTDTEYLSGTSIEYYIKKTPDFVRNILERCSMKYVILNYRTNDQNNDKSLQTIFEFLNLNVQRDKYFSKHMLIPSNMTMRRKMESMKYVLSRISYSTIAKFKSVFNWIKEKRLLSRISCCSAIVLIILFIFWIHRPQLYSDERFN